jgi:hypothetical protein
LSCNTVAPRATVCEALVPVKVRTSSRTDSPDLLLDTGAAFTAGRRDSRTSAGMASKITRERSSWNLAISTSALILPNNSKQTENQKKKKEEKKKKKKKKKKNRPFFRFHRVFSLDLQFRTACNLLQWLRVFIGRKQK